MAISLEQEKKLKSTANLEADCKIFCDFHQLQFINHATKFYVGASSTIFSSSLKMEFRALYIIFSEILR